MPELSNKTAFNILLDQYQEEAYNLYVVVKSLCAYPDVKQNGYEDLNGKLYSSAFALLLSNYLDVTIEMYEHEDLDSFVEKMDFEYDKTEIFKIAENNNIEFEDDFADLVLQVINLYRTKVINDLNNLFTDNSKLNGLFASIFQFEEGSEPNIDYLNVLHFLEEEIN